MYYHCVDSIVVATIIIANFTKLYMIVALFSVPFNTIITISN